MNQILIDITIGIEFDFVLFFLFLLFYVYWQINTGNENMVKSPNEVSRTNIISNNKGKNQ
jgi:hypothetical protein